MLFTATAVRIVILLSISCRCFTFFFSIYLSFRKNIFACQTICESIAMGAQYVCVCVCIRFISIRFVYLAIVSQVQWITANGISSHLHAIASLKITLWFSRNLPRYPLLLTLDNHTHNSFSDKENESHLWQQVNIQQPHTKCKRNVQKSIEIATFLMNKAQKINVKRDFSFIPFLL